MATSSPIDPSVLPQQESDVGQSSPVKSLPSAPEALPQETPKPDAFKSEKHDQAFQAKQFVRKPGDLGHKILTQHDAGRNSGEHQPRRGATADSKNYQKFLREPIFKQSKGSELYRALQGRSVDSGRKDSSALPNSYLKRLLTFRHQSTDRSNTFQVLRHELHLARQAKNRGEAANKAHRGHEADAFLQRASKLLKTLGLTGNESNFEKKLKEALAGKKNIAGLPDGKKAQFAAKSESSWLQFFKNALKLGSAEQSLTLNGEALDEALFRGLFKEAANENGKTLVADLSFADATKLPTEKFARILVEHPELLALLEQLKPGDTLSKDFLSRLGEELKYLKLVHQTDVLSAGARDASVAALMTQLKNQVSQQAMNRTEQSLIEERRRRAHESVQGNEAGEEHDATGKPTFMWWNKGKVFERARGKPKLGLFISYSLSLIVFLLMMYALLKNF